MEILTLINVKKYGHKSGIYYLKINGTKHSYVGSAKDLRKRLNSHRTALKRQDHRNSKLQNCYNKYGAENLMFEILEYCNITDLLIRESFYTKKLQPDLNIVQDPVQLNRGNEFREKISKIKKNYYKTHNAINTIPVYQYDKHGNFIRKYKSMSEAALCVKGNVSAICAVCNGRAKTHKGFQWSKEKRDSIKSLIKQKIKKENLKKQPSNSKIVYQFDLDGNFIKEWKSVSIAAKTLGINVRSIGLCASDKYVKYKSAGGFQWSFEKQSFKQKYENHSKDAKIKAIYILDILSQKEYYFDRIADAARFINPTINNFNSLCATISSATKRPTIIEKKYLVRKPNTKYKFANSKYLIDANGTIYNGLKNVPFGITVNKLIDCAREKFRESEKNQEFSWSTLIEDL